MPNWTCFWTTYEPRHVLQQCFMVNSHFTDNKHQGTIMDREVWVSPQSQTRAHGCFPPICPYIKGNACSWLVKGFVRVCHVRTLLSSSTSRKWRKILKSYLYVEFSCMFMFLLFTFVHIFPRLFLVIRSVMFVVCWCLFFVYVCEYFRLYFFTLDCDCLCWFLPACEIQTIIVELITFSPLTSRNSVIPC